MVAEVLNDIVNEAMDKFKREYELDSAKVVAPFEEQRYGYKGAMTVQYRGAESGLAIVAISPEHGTGKLPEGSRAQNGHKVLRPHDENTHEWIFNISKTPAIERYSSQFCFGTQGKLIKESLFPSHWTLYELEEELHLNPASPKGVTFRMHDTHALFNQPWTVRLDTQILLVHPVKKGAPLNEFQRMLVERTGIENYLLRIDPKTGGMR